MSPRAWACPGSSQDRCHLSLTMYSFSTRQFAGPVALFVVLCFIAVAVGKWVLYLGITCLLPLSLAYEYLV